MTPDPTGPSPADQGTAWQSHLACARGDDHSPFGIPITLAVTGHRDPAEPSAVREKLDELLDSIQRCFPNTPLQAVSALAEGADRLFAWAALNAGLPLDVVLPMPGKLYEEDFGSDDSKHEFRELLGKARYTETLPYIDGNDEQNVKEPERRNLQYAQVGLHLATRAQVLIALWDGQGARGLGGTAQVMSIRLEGRLQEQGVGGVEQVNALRLQGLLDEPDAGLVYWIETRRTGQEGNPHVAEPRWATEAGKWHKGHIVCSPGDQDRPRVIEHLMKLDDYNRKLEECIPRRAQASEGTSDEEPAASDDAPRHDELPGLAERLHKLHQAADRLSNRTIPNIRGKFVIIFVLAGMTVAAFDLWAHVWPFWFVLLTYLILIGVVGLRVRNLRRTKAYKEAVDLRALSEGLRVQAFWVAAGLGEPVARHYLRKHGKAMQWVRTALAGVVPVVPHQNSTVGEDMESARQVIRHWIKDQRDYYRESMEQRSHKMRWLLRTSVFFYWSAIVVAVIVLALTLPMFDLFSHHELHTARHWIIALLGMLPAISGLMASYVEFAGYRDDAREHGRMYALFEKGLREARELVPEGGEGQPAGTRAGPGNRHDTNWTPHLRNKFRQLVFELGSEALREQGEWAMLHKSHEPEIPKG